MATFDLDPLTLSIAIGSFIVITGQCCSCIRTSKKTSKYISEREAKVRKNLERLANAKDMPEEEQQAILDEAKEFTQLTSSKSYLHQLVVDPLDSFGDAINQSRLSFIWELFVNDTFIGRVFTQEVVEAPFRVIVQMLTTAGGFLIMSMITDYANQFDPAIRHQKVQQSFVLVYVFVTLFSIAIKIIDSYTREYQGDIATGKNIAELESKKDN